MPSSSLISSFASPSVLEAFTVFSSFCLSVHNGFSFQSWAASGSFHWANGDSGTAHRACMRKASSYGSAQGSTTPKPIYSTICKLLSGSISPYWAAVGCPTAVPVPQSCGLSVIHHPLMTSSRVLMAARPGNTCFPQFPGETMIPPISQVGSTWNHLDNDYFPYIGQHHQHADGQSSTII